MIIENWWQRTYEDVIRITRVHGLDRCMRRMRVEEWDNAKTENEWMVHS